MSANPQYPPPPSSTGYPQEMPPPYFQPTVQANMTNSTYQGQSDLPYPPQQYSNQPLPSTQYQPHKYPNQPLPSTQYPTQLTPHQYPNQPATMQYDGDHAPGPYRYQETPQYPDMPPPKYPDGPVPTNYHPGNQPEIQRSPYSQAYPSQGNTDDGSSLFPTSDSSQIIVEETNFSGFSEKAIRNGFIRKVYAILMLQLSFTVGVVCLFVFEKRVNAFVTNNLSVYLVAFFLFIAIYIALVCCGDLRRKHPTNIVLLSVFTVALTYLVATISCFHETKIVLMALGICTVCCLAVTIFSCFTKFDFTSCGGVLCTVLWVLIIFGFIAGFTYRTYPILNTVYAGLGALLFMMFLAFDTQLVMGGKKYQLSPEEYVFAALQLYMDIVQIFLFLLALFGGGKK